MRCFFLILSLGIVASTPSYALFGEELGPLLQLVSGQLSEIEKLTETLGVAKDQVGLLRELYAGVDQTLNQIQSIESIIERSKGLDPTAVRSLADLNDLLDRAKQSQSEIEGMMLARVELADQAIASSAAQTDTAYKMGQEMTFTGSQLAVESKTATPGRAAQISAAAGSAQMLASGVQLQTLSQLVQLQAMSLEFQKSQVQREMVAHRARQDLYLQELGQAGKKSGGMP